MNNLKLIKTICSMQNYFYKLRSRAYFRLGVLCAPFMKKITFYPYSRIVLYFLKKILIITIIQFIASVFKCIKTPEFSKILRSILSN